jgi:hypothetical protein
MFSHFSLREFVPADGIYNGSARISFGSPKGEVSGSGTIRLSPDGRVTMRVEVEEYAIPPEYHDFLLPFIQGSIPKTTGAGATTFGIGSATQSIEDVQLTATNARFRATRAMVSNSHFELFGGQNAWIEIVANDLELIIQDDTHDLEEMWCMPLFGNLGEFHACGNTSWLDDRSPCIHFDADGYGCGLLIFNPTDQSKQGDCAAVAFGNIGGRPHRRVEEVRELVPWGLISALDFACGSDITSPWLELRDQNGCLLRRTHQRAGTTHQEDGFAAFSRFDSSKIASGIAEFLRCFFRLPQQQRRSLAPPMNLIRSGAPGSATIDESIADLVKALDAICKRHGLGRTNLIKNLDSANSTAVERVTKEAREQLLLIRKQCKSDQKVDQLAVIDKIISRQANITGDELDFGIAVSALLNKFGLDDPAAMNTHYSQLPNDITWEGLLSSVRGQVIHSGAIHMNSRAELLAWFEFTRHLHDICKRLVLREIGYEGTYSASNIPYTGEHELDRVTPSTTTAQLGYTVPPAGI